MTLSSGVESIVNDRLSRENQQVTVPVVKLGVPKIVQTSVLEENYSIDSSQGTATTLHETDITAIKDLDVESGSENRQIVNQVSLDTHRSWSSILSTSQIQFMAVCFSLFLSGWNDSSIGPLLPRIQDVYQVNFTIVSLIFVFVCVGSLIGSLSTIYVTERFGFGKVIAFGALCQLVGYSIQVSAPPFPLFLFSFVLTGWGLQLQEAQANSYVTSLRSSGTKLGILHASYDLGAFTSPLVATQFVGISRWSLFFFVSFGFSLFNIAVLCLVFKFQRQTECLQRAGEVAQGTEVSENRNTFISVMRSKATHALAFFALMYVGVEVTIGGWIVTYIIDARGGGHTSGYVSSGFWGGITIGRIVLLGINRKIGAKRVLFIYAISSIALELVVWLVPSLIGDSIAISVIGIFFGPMYPLIIHQASHIIPRPILLTGSIGWISGIGQIGSALIPFIAGAVAQKHGISSLQPMLIGMMCFMTCLWAIIPHPPRTV